MGRLPFIAVLFAAALATSSCSATAGASPQPAGPHPSVLATMICRPKAERDISQVLGVPARVSNRTWRDHLYTCFFDVPGGHFVVSVKELSSWSETRGYFAREAHPGRWRMLFNLGQAAEQAPAGSVIVRKDWKVLLVDVSGLPAELGSPPSNPPEVGLGVATAIMDCWHGD